MGKTVGPHDPGESTSRRHTSESGKRRGGGERTEPLLKIGDDEARMAGGVARDLEPLVIVAVIARILERVLRRDQPPHPVKPQPVKGEERNRKVAAMGGIEGSAEQADALPTAEDWGNDHGRVCPAPRI